VGRQQGERDRRLQDVGVAQERPGRVGGEQQEHHRSHQRHRRWQPPGEQSVEKGGVGRQDQPADREHAEHAGEAVSEVGQFQPEQEPQRPALWFGVAERQNRRGVARVGGGPGHRQHGERVVVAEEPDLSPAGEVREPRHGRQEHDRHHCNPGTAAGRPVCRGGRPEKGFGEVRHRTADGIGVGASAHARVPHITMFHASRRTPGRRVSTVSAARSGCHHHRRRSVSRRTRFQ
jgi:hypothetical protein